MKMNQENMKRFESMMKDFMDENGLRVEFVFDWDKRQTRLRVEEFETRAVRNLVVDWDTKKSLSQAGAIIFAYITREFDLDNRNSFGELKIKDVIFNDPATIVFWEDGTKTVVKCQDGDVYSKELGLAMCISKKALGNKGNFNEVFKKWIPDEEYNHINMPADPEFMAAVLSSVKENLEKCIRRPFEGYGL